MNILKTAYFHDIVRLFFSCMVLANTSAVKAMVREVDQELNYVELRQDCDEQAQLERTQLRAKLELAKMLAAGDGGDLDCEAARQRYEEVIKQSYDPLLKAQALIDLANLYLSDEFIKKVDFRDGSKAFEYYHLAAEQNDCLKSKAIALLRLSQMHKWGLGTDKNLDKAAEYARQVQNQTHSLWAQAKAWRILGDYNYYGTAHAFGNQRLGFEYYMKAANQTESLSAQAESWRMLGDVYHYGIVSIDKDPVKAKEYYEKAANQTCSRWAQAESWRLLGEMHDRGSGVEVNKLKAEEYFQLAALQESSKWARAEAWTKLGDLYLFSDEVGKDYDKAKECFEKALNDKRYSYWAYAESCRRLGEIYMGHYGFTPDETKAMSLLKEAIDQTSVERANSEALYLMGELLMGLKKYEEAKIHFERCLEAPFPSPWAKAGVYVALSKMYMEGVLGKKDIQFARIHLHLASIQNSNNIARTAAERLLKELN